MILRSLLDRDSLDCIKSCKGLNPVPKASAIASPDSNPSLRYSKMHHADHTVYCKRHDRTIHVRSACKGARAPGAWRFDPKERYHRAAPSDTPFLPPPMRWEVKNRDSTAESSGAGRIVLKKRQRLPLSPDFNL
ncbi:hypothetical protein ACIFQM_09390 [Paenibacillus sp. NRS-1782]|uniref:hypothetical protein n=1 Tax=unclassified Paenibacillus TaxID=185978 RepID=UPI003D29549D